MTSQMPKLIKSIQILKMDHKKRKSAKQLEFRTKANSSE
jgi:hypothetical protein